MGWKNFRKSQKIVTLIRLTELFAQVANKTAKSPTYSRLLLKKMFFFLWECGNLILDEDFSQWICPWLISFSHCCISVYSGALYRSIYEDIKLNERSIMAVKDRLFEHQKKKEAAKKPFHPCCHLQTWIWVPKEETWDAIMWFWLHNFSLIMFGKFLRTIFLFLWRNLTHFEYFLANCFACKLPFYGCIIVLWPVLWTFLELTAISITKNLKNG